MFTMKRKHLTTTDLANFNSCRWANEYSLTYTHSFPRARKEKIFSLLIRYNSNVCLIGLEATLAENSGIYSAETMEGMLSIIQYCASVNIEIFLFQHSKSLRLRTEVTKPISVLAEILKIIFIKNKKNHSLLTHV